MSNHTKVLEHVTLTSWIFLKFLPVVRYHRDMKILKILASDSKHFKIYSIFKNWQIGAGCAPADILNTAFSLISSVSNNFLS